MLYYEWLNASILELIDFIEECSVEICPSDRKIRLVSCAFYRNLWEILPENFRKAIEISEKYVDSRVSFKKLNEGSSECTGCCSIYPKTALYIVSNKCRVEFKQNQITQRKILHDIIEYPLFQRQILCPSCKGRGKLDCIIAIGREYRTLEIVSTQSFYIGEKDCPTCKGTKKVPGIKKEWITPLVKSMCEEIYEKRAFEDMPILADALEEASCPELEIVKHCRSKEVHYRGCWVLDLMLGKL